MRNKVVLLFVVFVIFALIFTGQFLFQKLSATEGRLKVIASPNAMIYLNTMEVGKTPFDQKIKQGDYIIKLTSINDSTQSAVFESKIRINKGTISYVSQDLGATSLTSSGVIFTLEKMTQKPEKSNTGEIEVQSEPSGATVYLDSEEHGNSALVLTNIEKGQHEVTVSSPGFFPRTEKVDVIDGYRVVARFKLAIDPSHKKVDESIDKKLASQSAALAITPTTTTQANKTTLLIKETGTGFLRVRSEASTSASESARVKPGAQFELLEESAGWYKIEYEKGKTGWVSAQYATKQTP